MRKRLRKLYTIHIAFLIVDFLIIIICLISLFFGAASFLEWLFLFVTTVVEIPSSIYALSRIKDEMQKNSFSDPDNETL